MTNRDIATIQEVRVAKELGGVTIGGSGSSPFEKADVRLDNILIECKTLAKERISHTIKKEWLVKLRKQATGMGKQNYALAFDFGDGDDYFIIDLKQMKEFINLLGERYEQET